MKTPEARQLRRFFGVDGGRECSLYLPTFEGSAIVESDASSTASRGAPMQYRGATFADRDAKAAFYVSSILSREIGSERIHWEKATAYRSRRQGTAFLFGSRSNEATRRITKDAAFDKFVHFEFGTAWSIRAGDKVFSMPAPDKLDREQYERQTDYGVIARFNSSRGAAPTFLIAGLGSRATEGSGYYLSHHWRDLARRFGSDDFALILRFKPPIDPRKSDVVAELQGSKIDE